MSDISRGTDTKAEDAYFRVPAELQIRWRKIDDEELRVFRSFAMRPSPHSSLKQEIDIQLQSMDIRPESKTLFEKAFQILINLDQRLERIEEQLTGLAHPEKASTVEAYEWVHGDLSASGVEIHSEEICAKIKKGDQLLLDLILPSLPEQRVVCAALVKDLDAENANLSFIGIHEEDKEFVHRFVTAREREILRQRALERERAKTGET